MGVCTQEDSAPRLRQEFWLWPGFKPPFLSIAMHKIQALSPALSPLVRLKSSFPRFCCGAAAAKVLVLQRGHFQGQTQRGKSRSAEQTLAKADHPLDKVFIPLACWRSAEGARELMQLCSQLCMPDAGVKTHSGSMAVSVVLFTLKYIMPC